jgi:shikimate kinase
MGSGKTTIGRQLAQALQWSFFDTDAMIEASERKTVSEIFAAVGEVKYRQYEYRLMLQLLPSILPSVMACGGGLPCIPYAMTYLNRYSITVYLQTPVDLLCARLRDHVAQRPLLHGTGDLREAVETLLMQRQQFYQQAQWILNTEGKSIEELCSVLHVLVEKDI